MAWFTFAGIPSDVLTSKVPQKRSLKVRTDVGEIDTANSTTTPLLAGQEFVGTYVDVINFVDATVIVNSDVSSAVDGAVVEYSSDGVNVDRKADATFVPNGAGVQFILPATAKFYRLRYKNGSTDQTFFRLQAVLHRVGLSPASLPIGAKVTDNTLANIGRTILTGKIASGPNAGDYINVRVNPQGRLESESTGQLLGQPVPNNAFLGGAEDPGGIVRTNKQDASGALLTSTRSRVADGTWGYRAGVDGTVSVGAGRRVIKVSCYAGASDATVTINSGNTITVPAGEHWTMEPGGNLVAPAITFTGTASYWLEYVE